MSTTAESVALSKDMKRPGWKCVGPTTVYACMQAMGMINDHVEDYVTRTRVERARPDCATPAYRISPDFGYFSRTRRIFSSTARCRRKSPWRAS
jgi:hypothetical protein